VKKLMNYFAGQSSRTWAARWWEGLVIHKTDGGPGQVMCGWDKREECLMANSGSRLQ
jgi:hypothetical protein